MRHFLSILKEEHARNTLLMNLCEKSEIIIFCESGEKRQ